MEKEVDFVIKPKKQELLKKDGMEGMWRDELQADISAFPSNSRPLIEKYFREGVGKENQGGFDNIRNIWWHNKYGFPFNNKAARAEVLRRKYAPQKEVAEVNDLQTKLLKAIQREDGEGVSRIKKLYEEKYPEQIEGIEVLFGLKSFLEIHKRLKKHKEKGEVRKKMIVEMTQYQFLLSDFILNNGKNKEFLSNFWDVVEEAGRRTNTLSIAHALRRSILSQVAVFRVFEKLGKKPFIAHPREDAFNAIDIWTDQESVVQVKGAYEEEHKQPILVETDTISFPGVEVTKEDEILHLNSFLMHKMQEFKAKVSAYKSVIGKNLRGYLVVVPYSKFDFVTGEPSEDIVSFVKQKMDSKEEKPQELAAA